MGSLGDEEFAKGQILYMLIHIASGIGDETTAAYSSAITKKNLSMYFAECILAFKISESNHESIMS